MPDRIPRAGGVARISGTRWRLAPLAMMVILLPLAACGKSQPAEDSAVLRGRAAIERHGCVACHVIPRVPGPGANVGPPLAHMASRAYIGGVLPNQPPEMVRWLMNPPEVDPRTAMPNLGLTEEEAKDIAAYLYTLE